MIITRWYIKRFLNLYETYYSFLFFQLIMESKNQSFYKRYAARLKDEQEPVAGTSKTPLMKTVSKPAVLKRLIFKTPEKKNTEVQIK